MGLRVTTRTRPRRDFPVIVGTTTAAAAAADNLAGPFTQAQLVELIFRVRKVRITASISHARYIDPAPEEEPFTEATTTDVDIAIPRRNTSDVDSPEIADEVEILIHSEIGMSFFNDTNDGWFTGVLSSIVKDESGGYWMRINFGGSPVGAGFSSDTSIQGDTLEFNATFTLGGVDFSIPAIAIAMEVTAASLMITVEEWWPYATTTGSAAYDTATGAAINGGPAA
jgi:hypothetical protein